MKNVYFWGESEGKWCTYVNDWFKRIFPSFL